MGSAFKSVVIGLGVLLGVLVLAGVLAVITFDPNDYKADIEQAVQEATGRDFVIDGDLSLSFFPWFAVELPKLTLANRAGFGDQPMFNVNNASLALKIMPLLSGTLEVGEVQIDGAEINLEIKPDGTNNWDDIVATLETSTSENGDNIDVEVDLSTDGEDIPSSAEPLAVEVAGVRITNTAVRYIDAPGEATFVLEDFRFVTGAISTGKDVDLDGGFRFETEPAALAGSIEFAGKVLSLGQDDRTLIEDLTITGELSGDDVGNVPVNVAAERIDYASVAGTLAVDKLSAAFANLAVETTLNGQGFNDTPTMTGNLVVYGFSVPKLLETLGQPPLEMASPDALTDVGVTSKITITPSVITLTDALIGIDETKFNGRFVMRTDERTSYEFALDGTTLNIDDYLAPATEDAGATAGEASVDDTEIPVELLRSMDAKGTIKLEQVVMSGLQFNDIDVGINLAGGALRLNPIKANLFEGSYSGDIRIDASRSTPRLSLNETVADVQLEPLFVAMFDTENLTGTIDGRFQLAGTGNNLGSIRETLGGDIAFALADGELAGTDLWYQIRRAKALFDQEAPPETPANPSTPFSDIRATAKVADGVLSNNDFTAALPFLQLTGAGEVDLAQSVVNYTMNARVLERPDFAGATAEELDEYTEAVIPLKITGSLAEPSIAPDIAGLAKARVQQEIDKKKDELTNKLLDKLGIAGDEAANDADGAAGETAADGEPVDAEELLKQKAEEKLFDLLNKKKK
ncbi:MAG: AsmA family protein [Pseudomonadota bacterium]